MSRRPAASIVASPVLVGAVTVLVAIVAVFLAYNANQGLPFVPTYDVKAELPSGSNLVKGNEVRIGGFRVGLVDEITPATRDTADRENDAIAIISMKLDKAVDPLPADTTIFVRQRSALGLKYVELTPGTSEEGIGAGDTIAAGAGQRAGRVRRRLLDLRQPDARELADRARGLRRRPGRPRRLAQPRDRGVPAAVHPPRRR